MSERERTGHRDLTYSAWHRTLDPSLHYIDLDDVEFCAVCKKPLALIEVARDSGQWKPASVTWTLAKLAGLPAWCILYRVDEEGQIVSFRVRRLPETQFDMLTPEEYEDLLLNLRKKHTCKEARRPKQPKSDVMHKDW